MKKFFSLAFCSIVALNAYSQKLESGSFECLKNVDRIAIDVDFSKASIHGMSEKAFSKYETDWEKDKPEIIGDFIGGVADKLSSVISIADKSETQWVLRINVKSVSQKGNFVCTADLLNNENVEAHIVDIHGSGGSFGSKLNLIKDGVEKTSKNCGAFFKKIVSKAKK